MFERVFKGKDILRLMRDFTAWCSGIAADTEYQIVVKEHKKKRSLDANAYAWVLISKLADAMTGEAQGDVAYSKDDVYRMMLKSYGQGGIVKVPHKDIEHFKRAWKYNEEHEALFDERAVYFKFWVGSSNYNTHEMSLFINGIVAECKEQGIETEPPHRLAAMMEDWDAKYIAG